MPVEYSYRPLWPVFILAGKHDHITAIHIATIHIRH